VLKIGYRLESKVIKLVVYLFNDLCCMFFFFFFFFFFSNYLIELILLVGTSSTKEEDMDIQNILDDYNDEDESGVTRMEESGNDS
jgi:hypothetical protein